MTAGRLGWFVLGYLVLGFGVNVILNVTIMAIAALKDAAKDYETTECSDNLIEAMNEAFASSEDCFPDDPPKVSLFKTFLIGLLTWPVSLPKAFIELYKSIK